jgi:hypothetical protein
MQKFEGWCSVEEYEKWTAETEEHDRKITEQVMRQIAARRRMKAMETIKQTFKVLIVVLGIAALPFIVVYAVAAWFGL